MLKRFKEKTNSYEFILKFRVTCEKTDESTISMAGNTPGEIVDVKERRRYVRKEMKDHCSRDNFAFSADLIDNSLFDHLIHMVSKANIMLNAIDRDEIDYYFKHHEPHI